MIKAPQLAIVVPCYNEAEVLPETTHRLLELLDRLIITNKAAPESHVTYVDDGSTDETWARITALHGQDTRVKGIRLSANRGHQVALLAGLFSVAGDVVVSIDADLQDDISAIELMLDAHAVGNHVVYGVRRLRRSDSWRKRVSAETYYRLLALLGVKVVFNHADFRLLSRRAVEALKQYGEVNLFLRGLIPLLGFASTVVYYDRQPRFAGTSKYSLSKMLLLALDGVTSFTAFPLRVIAFLGLAVSIASAGMILWVLWTKLFTTAAIPGWASSVIPIYLLGGIQLFSIGVVGEYIGKVFFETKRRPRYFIQEFL